MLHNLPKMLEDQTLYSWCGLVQAWNGSGAIATSRYLFGSSYAALMHDFPALLVPLTERTRGLLGDPRALALQHTLLGYFLPLLPAELAEQVILNVLTGSMPELKMKLGIAASRVGSHHPLKGCPACFDDDQEDHGFAYWHLVEQFPSVMVCRKHMRPLVMAWDPVTPVHRRGWILPRGGLKREWIEVPISREGEVQRLLQVAEYSARFATMDPGSLDPHVLAKTYQKALHGRGLASAKGSLRVAALIKATRSHFRGIESVPGFEALQAITGDWPGLAGALARRQPRPGHPLKHLLLISMLFETWEEFCRAYQESQSGIENISPSSPGASPTKSMDAFRIHVLDGSSIRAASTKVGVCTATGVIWAQRLGLSYTARTKIFSEEKKREARRQLWRGADPGEVATAVGVARITINRLLASEPNVKEAWRVAHFAATQTRARNHFRTLVRRNPYLSVKALRAIPDNGYMWLYRNDRAWLQQHLPALWSGNKAV